jgi:hypothetical protein
MCRRLRKSSSVITSPTRTLEVGQSPEMEFCYSEVSILINAGYNLFIGDPLSPIAISKTYSTPTPHWSARIRATLYKIDSWNNENLFVTIDGLTQKVYTWNSSFNGSDICGIPNPVIDSLNPSYSDGPVSLDLNVTHNASTLTLGLSTTLNSWVQSWGVTHIQIDLD